MSCFRRPQEGSLMSRRIQDNSLLGFRSPSSSLKGDLNTEQPFRLQPSRFLESLLQFAWFFLKTLRWWHWWRLMSDWFSAWSLIIYLPIRPRLSERFILSSSPLPPSKTYIQGDFLNCSPSPCSVPKWKKCQRANQTCCSIIWWTHWLLFRKLDWCDPGVWRCLLKTCWGCYCCWC